MSSHRPARRSTRRSTTRAMPLASACRKTRRSRQAAPTPLNNYQVLAGASWEIDLWGRVRRLTQAAQANLAGHRGGPPRRDPESGRHGGQQLSAAARTGRAARDFQAHARDLREVAEAVRAQVQARPDLADERGAGQSPVPDRRGADPAHQISRSRSSRTRISILLGTQPRPDSARQDSARARAARGPRRTALRSCSSAGPTCCRPSSS